MSASAATLPGCATHVPYKTVYTMTTARERAADLAWIAPEHRAEYIATTRHAGEPCCPAAGFARYLMMAAHREHYRQRDAAIPDCYRCGLAAELHPTGLPCPAPDDFWNCPEHRTELLYVNEPDVPLEEHYQCPAPGCIHGRWVS